MSVADGRVPVCVFTKPPLAGESKTRLARVIGEGAAQRLARAFFEDTWATVGALGWARPILATTAPDASAFGLAGEAVEVWPQGAGDLGQRMERILARVVGEAGRAILIGADLPGLPPQHLDIARDDLDHHEAVLGPADDGGFYLVGLSRVPRGLFTGLGWSAPDTLVRTERRLVDCGLTLARAPSWFDVDEIYDLARVRRMLDSEPTRAPRTRAALVSLGFLGLTAS